MADDATQSVLWPIMYQQAQHWVRSGCSEVVMEDLRSLPREFAGRGSPRQ